MKRYLKTDPWSVIEEGFHAEYNRISESIFSLGNGAMGQRGNFEEHFSGETLQGSYVAGVYYPDKTRVGWWKNGYPEYFAKVLNAPSWIGMDVTVEGERLDLATASVQRFRRELDMRRGVLLRSMDVTLPNGKAIRVESIRFCSVSNKELGAIRYSVTPLNFSGKITISLGVDADIVNQDANYDEKFWEPTHRMAREGEAVLIARTKKTGFHVCTGINYSWDNEAAGVHLVDAVSLAERPAYAGNVLSFQVNNQATLTITKLAAILSSENHLVNEMESECMHLLGAARAMGFDQLLRDHMLGWEDKWTHSDIVISGDVDAQQGIRFNIFQLLQTYTGEDARLNIGPKGFTGEKYGGSTYWDTEAYCLPFYMSTTSQKVARNLLVYRYKHLQKAIENATKLGFNNGAALYPMVTINGEECHNEWEITFEEIHRNGAIAYAIWDYVRYTGDESYLVEYGLEVLIGISRFWTQRVNWSEEKQRYVILGVTGPNEYENNVNNNWYTNYIARWTLTYTAQECLKLKGKDPVQWNRIAKGTLFQDTELDHWRAVGDLLYFPEDTRRGIFLQQDGFLDKEIVPAVELNPADRPLNQKWSWDRILRSCYIKQADVLQGIYFFEDDFDLDTVRRNFDFYEPLTVHESSLSPCIHVILASVLGYRQKAYELYLRTSRLDLDDYNNDTEDGLHITSMAGTWMSVVKGFGGLRVRDGQLHLKPFIPAHWDSYSFVINFRGRTVRITVSQKGVSLHLILGDPLDIWVDGRAIQVGSREKEVMV